ncbi:MAG: CoA transferase [Acidimicrobiales bacterium]
MSDSGDGREALWGVRVLDLTTGLAGPMAGMLFADFGADVVKVEGPGGDPARTRPGFLMWNRGKRSVVIDPDVPEDLDLLAGLVAGSDVCIAAPLTPALEAVAGAEPSTTENPGLIYLHMPPVLGATPWPLGHESAGLLWAYAGMSLRQSSFEGGPIDPVFPYMLYLQAIWAVAAATAALHEREHSGHGQVVTVGGVHATMVAASASLTIDPSADELKANYGPGGPHPMYTRYQCADGAWLFLATLTTKFQERAIEVLGLDEVINDERLGGKPESMLLPANRRWVREWFVATFASRTSDEWLKILREADVPAGPLLVRDDWMDSPRIAAVGMRVEVEDPEHGHVVMPGNPINLVRTPASTDRTAPRLGDCEPGAVDWAPRPAPSSPAPSDGAPLKGVRVLDLGTILAGPYAGTLLSELGADVIKVETLTGDSWRERGMPYIRGQRGIAVDLRSPAGLEAFHALVRSSDVVLDNYRAGVLTRLGIDHERLVEVKPDIITVSITGFGDTGPFAGEPAFDPLLQARSGMMVAQGGDSEPVLMTVAVNDVVTAASAVLGTLVALFHRNRSGAGQHVWLSLAGTAALAQNEELVRVPGRADPIIGGRDFIGPGALDRSYATRDGWVRIQVPDGSIDRLRVAGLFPQLDPAGDPTAQLVEAFAGLTRDEAVERLAAAKIPAVPVRRLRELIDDPDYQHADVFNKLERSDGTSVFAPGRYALFSRSRRHDTLTPPGVGEHTAQILAEVGFSAAEIDEMASRDAIRLGSPMVHRTLAAYR